MASQYTEKQIRNGAVGSDYAPGAQTDLRDKFSEDALVYIDQVARLQAAAARDPYLNGKDAERRLHGNG
jgi:hypothetical protein